ncbi:hypothetical protein GUG04_20875, partial [Xanthomonas citri pv. citri]|nr:hypothetical protein [Xanthomonas citri pv. citri]
MRILLLALLPLSAANAATLEIVNHTGARARVAELFNVCQKDVFPVEKPIWLEDGEFTRLEVPLVMQYY